MVDDSRSDGVVGRVGGVAGQRAELELQRRHLGDRTRSARPLRTRTRSKEARKQSLGGQAVLYYASSHLWVVSLERLEAECAVRQPMRRVKCKEQHRAKLVRLLEESRMRSGLVGGE